MAQCNSVLHCPQKGEMIKSREVTLKEKRMSQRPFPLLSQQEGLQKVRSAWSDTGGSFPRTGLEKNNSGKFPCGNQFRYKCSGWRASSSLHSSPQPLWVSAGGPKAQVTELSSLSSTDICCTNQKVRLSCLSDPSKARFYLSSIWVSSPGVWGIKVM